MSHTGNPTFIQHDFDSHIADQRNATSFGYVTTVATSITEQDTDVIVVGENNPDEDAHMLGWGNHLVMCITDRGFYDSFRTAEYFIRAHGCINNGTTTFSTTLNQINAIVRFGRDLMVSHQFITAGVSIPPRLFTKSHFAICHIPFTIDNTNTTDPLCVDPTWDLQEIRPYDHATGTFIEIPLPLSLICTIVDKTNFSEPPLASELKVVFDNLLDPLFPYRSMEVILGNGFRSSASTVQNAKINSVTASINTLFALVRLDYDIQTQVDGYQELVGSSSPDYFLAQFMFQSGRRMVRSADLGTRFDEPNGPFFTDVLNFAISEINSTVIGTITTAGQFPSLGSIPADWRTKLNDSLANFGIDPI